MAIQFGMYEHCDINAVSDTRYMFTYAMNISFLSVLCIMLEFNCFSIVDIAPIGVN